MNQKDQHFRRTNKPRVRFPVTHGAARRTYYAARHNDHSSPALTYRCAGKSVYINVILQGKAVEDYVISKNLFTSIFQSKEQNIWFSVMIRYDTKPFFRLLVLFLF